MSVFDTWLDNRDRHNGGNLLVNEDLARLELFTGHTYSMTYGWDQGAAPAVASVVARYPVQAPADLTAVANTIQAIETEDAIRSVATRYGGAESLLVGLALADSHPESAVAEFEIGNIEGNALRSSEGACKTKQENCAVAEALWVVTRHCNHRDNLVGRRRCLAGRALPVVRRMPRNVALTASELVGGSWPASLWA